MAATTYKYWKPDPNLRSDYGGAAIQDGGDSAEVSKMDLAQRHICREAGWPLGATRFIAEIGNDGSDDWMEISDDLYTGISSYLTATELTTVTSTMPAGYSATSKQIALQPYPDKTNIYLRGDSISAGLGTSSGNLIDTMVGQAADDLDTITWDSGTVRHGVGDNYAVFSTALGSSSWGNTNSPNHEYPEREDLAYPQRTQTIPLNGGNCIFIYWLGTNDINYDSSKTGSDVWTRASTRIAALRSEFPNLKIIVCTLIRRGEDDPLTEGTQNYKLNAYNVLARANYATAGADYLLDLDAASTELSVLNGDTTDITYYTDGTHLTTAGHALLVAATKTAIQSV